MENKYVEQFKTIQDLELVVNQIIVAHRDVKRSQLGVMFWVVVPPNGATNYIEGAQGPYRVVEGVRICDYNFEKATNLEWVIPDLAMGFSFSKTFSHLKNTRKMLSRHAKGLNKPGPANVA